MDSFETYGLVIGLDHWRYAMSTLDNYREKVREFMVWFLEEMYKTEGIREIDSLLTTLNNNLEAERKCYTEEARREFVVLQIAKLNMQDELSEDDSRNLVLGGMDEYSLMSYMDLYARILAHRGEEFTSAMNEQLKLAFGDKKRDKARAMRWIVRGLNVDHAIAKIEFDKFHFG